MLNKQLVNTTRGRIVTLLRSGGATVDDIAAHLSLTPNAVRAQVASMESDGVIQRRGYRPGITRPAQVFELTPEVERLLSRAYIPVLTHLVRVFATRLPARQVEDLLRATGAELADELSGGQALPGTLRDRLAAATTLLNDQLGAVTHVEENGGYVIRGVSCPLSAVTGKHPALCLAIESLVTRVVGVGARECCDRDGRPRCCFEISTPKKRRSR